MMIDRRMMMQGAGAATLLAASRTGAAATPTYWSRRVSVRAEGVGSDVLLIPGLGTGPAIWNATRAAAPGHRYHLMHVRGFAGLAPDGNAQGPILNPVMEEIARYITVMGLGRPAVVGHSMGGMEAMLLALAHPDLVGRLMVVDMLPAGAGMLGGTAGGLGFLGDQLFGYFTGTQAGRRQFAQMMRDLSPGGGSNDPDVVAVALREMANIDLGPRLSRIRAPMSVVYAVASDAQERTARTQQYRSAYAGAKNAKLVPIGPSGHVIMIDQPAQFAGALRTFLA